MPRRIQGISMKSFNLQTKVTSLTNYKKTKALSALNIKY
jgi:hypothetical protein